MVSYTDSLLKKIWSVDSFNVTCITFYKLRAVPVRVHVTI